MIFFRISKDSKVLLSNIENDAISARRIYRHFPDCDIELLATDYDYKVLANKHIADRTALAYAQLIKLNEDIKNNYKQEYSILSHNLITSHSLLQDHVWQIIPEESLSLAENYFEQVEIIKKSLEANNHILPESILSIEKRTVDLQAQIEGFKMLGGTNKLDIGNHNIKKVLQNIIHPFFDDFQEKGVKIRWDIDYDVAELNPIKIDYKVLNLALHHFLNNTVKYAKPYSYVDISFDFKTNSLLFEMVSIRIEKSELEKIFSLKYRGINARNIEAGEGIGMYMVKKALDLLKTDILVYPDYTEQETVNGIKYVKNKFYFCFMGD